MKNLFAFLKLKTIRVAIEVLSKGKSLKSKSCYGAYHF